MMRYVMAAVGTLLMVWIIWTSPGEAAKSYNLSLRGVEVSGGGRSALTLVGNSSGSLPGSFEMFIQYNPATNAITGGTWKLAVSQQERNRAPVMIGALAGSVVGGTLKIGKHGKINSAEGIQITVRRGTGTYSHVASGTGELRATLSPRRQHPFTGALRISF